MTEPQSLKTVLFFSGETFLRNVGGISKVSWSLADEFERRGISSVFLAPPRSERVPAELLSPRQLFFPCRKFHGRSRAQNAKFLEKIIAEKQVSLIIFQDGAAASFPLPEVVKKTGVLLFSVSHNTPNCWLDDLNARHSRERKHAIFDEALFAIRVWRHRRRQIRRMRLNYKISDKIVLLSEGFRAGHEAFLKKEQGVDKIVAISNPASFPRSEVDFSKKKRELLFVGRMENGQKRVDLLLKIWAKLEARFPDWSLRLVGDGNDLPANKKLAENLGLRRAFFEGFQNPENYYREASIFCMTSAYEGFGMVLVESAAFGCVPVAFDSFAAVRDIISDGENGVLVPAFDLDAYAEKLAQLMSDDALRERLAQTALSQIPEKFSAQKIAQKWLDLFDSCKGNANPKFSVITVCRNAAGTIEETIRSVAAQTYKNKEFIVIDGASTDGTLEILSHHKSEIDVLVSEPDKGIYDAMNKGILRATGDYLIFINADDSLYAPETLEKIAALNPTADLILGKQVNVFAGREEVVARGGVDVYRLVYLGAIFHQATFFKKTLFEKFGLYDTAYKIAADGDFVAKAFLNGALWQKTSEIIAKFSCDGISWNSTDAEHWSVVGKYLGNPLPLSIRALKRIEKIFRGVLGKDDFSPSFLRGIWIFFMNKACERAVTRQAKNTGTLIKPNF